MVEVVSVGVESKTRANSSNEATFVPAACLLVNCNTEITIASSRVKFMINVLQVSKAATENAEGAFYSVFIGNALWACCDKSGGRRSGKEALACATRTNTAEEIGDDKTHNKKRNSWSPRRSSSIARCGNCHVLFAHYIVTVTFEWMHVRFKALGGPSSAK